MSDADGELNSLKFTYQYQDGRTYLLHLRDQRPGSVFVESPVNYNLRKAILFTFAINSNPMT